MIGACRLNNKSMRNIRRNEVYQCLAIDLAMLGVISKEECEMLIGSGIPKGLILPNGKQGEFVSEENLPEQPAFIQTEPEKEPVVTGDTGTGDGTQEPVQTPEQTPEIVAPNADIVGAGFVTQDAGTVTTDNGDVSPIEGDGTQEPVNDEGRTESDN